MTLRGQSSRPKRGGYTHFDTRLGSGRQREVNKKKRRRRKKMHLKPARRQKEKKEGGAVSEYIDWKVLIFPHVVKGRKQTNLNADGRHSNQNMIQQTGR